MVNDDNKIIPPDRQDSYEVSELKALGAEGKLWTLETIYNLDSETRRFVERNLEVSEVRKKRRIYFHEGFALRLESGSYLVVPPFDIIRMYLNKQVSYFPE